MVILGKWAQLYKPHATCLDKNVINKWNGFDLAHWVFMGSYAVDDASGGRPLQLAAERRKARRSAAEDRQTEPAGPRLGLYRALFTRGGGFGPEVALRLEALTARTRPRRHYNASVMIWSLHAVAPAAATPSSVYVTYRSTLACTTN